MALNRSLHARGRTAGHLSGSDRAHALPDRWKPAAGSRQ